MVSCLTLIRNTHILAGRQGDHSHTMCGLAVASEHVGPAMFAETSEAATCVQCRRGGQAIKQSAKNSIRPVDPKALVASLVDRLNANDSDGLLQHLAGQLAADFSPTWPARLHDMFPAWRANIDEMIADGETVALRYHVTCIDAFGLLGPRPIGIDRTQMVILRVSGDGVVGVEAIVDDFRVWQMATPEKDRRAACRDPYNRCEHTT